ncbi:hypothetical protein H6A16_01020 [Collinsella tanakaei]|uniref:hypothetical protein n=1 Tax=Collinsella tanakaei TaxID=626935 RepID=UPI0019591F5C|nr:hypothetical protein [Collinsella tanakaei]
MDVRKAGAIALSVLSVAFRLAGIAFAILTVMLCFPSAAARLGISDIVIDLSRALPDLIEGYGLVTSPFGGVFRLDFALAMLALFGLDYLCQRVSWNLR